MIVLLTMINNKPSPIAFYRPLINRLPEFILHITAQTANLRIEKIY
nr:MAG TPA: hypothetical protein [Caudoviricetes sp.]